jgi:hypothetical protein
LIESFLPTFANARLPTLIIINNSFTARIYHNLLVKPPQTEREHPTFVSFPLSPNPFSQKGRRGTGFKVPLPPWERDLG